jgi:hypothetical protein
MNWLGVMYENGRGGLPKDDAQAVGWYRKAADAREAWGMNNLGVMYANGRGGLPKDDAQAVSWYRKAADAGNARSMNNLGVMYENGRGGLPKEDAQAVGWYVLHRARWLGGSSFPRRPSGRRARRITRVPHGRPAAAGPTGSPFQPRLAFSATHSGGDRKGIEWIGLRKLHQDGLSDERTAP